MSAAHLLRLYDIVTALEKRVASLEALAVPVPPRNCSADVQGKPCALAPGHIGDCTSQWWALNSVRPVEWKCRYCETPYIEGSICSGRGYTMPCAGPEAMYATRPVETEGK